MSQKKAVCFSDITQKVFELLQQDLPDILSVKPKLKLAINISSSQLMDNQCLQLFAVLHETIGIPPRQLELEITEGAIISDVEGTAKKLKSFKATGIRIAIDDFGTGFSTMSHLGKNPADMLKIDRSFVMNYPDTSDGSIAILIINTAENLNIDVIAEGVETKVQKDFLLQNNCHLMQGFYFSTPLNKQNLISLLKSNND
jgi:EAL domain-containing protein (putative c-di-GMP-specific phosphodiesterase class I)